MREFEIGDKVRYAIHKKNSVNGQKSQAGLTKYTLSPNDAASNMLFVQRVQMILITTFYILCLEAINYKS